VAGLAPRHRFEELLLRPDHAPCFQPSGSASSQRMF
jgi:hypothetical protein